LSFSGQQYYFYLVHTSSPDSYQHFLMRNDQLTTFAKDFSLQAKSRTSDKVIVAGDFNLTPWSYYYRGMQTLFSWKLSNVTQQLPILFTWRLFDFPLLRAHIDHMRVSSGIIVDSFQSIPIVGSDHRGLLMELKNGN
jgi:endonuclease/exonuclease/phosphatase (EEP) superfamily protein YafD